MFITENLENIGKNDEENEIRLSWYIDTVGYLTGLSHGKLSLGRPMVQPWGKNSY